MNEYIVEILIDFGFSDSFIEDEQQMIPSVFELFSDSMEEYTKIIERVFGDSFTAVEVIEEAFYEHDYNGVFEAFDLLEVGAAEKEIPVACRECIELCKNEDIVEVLADFGFSDSFIEDEQQVIPSVFELFSDSMEEYTKIIERVFGDPFTAVEVIEEAFYEHDYNGVFEAFDLLEVGAAEKEIPVACRECIELCKE